MKNYTTPRTTREAIYTDLHAHRGTWNNRTEIGWWVWAAVTAVAFVSALLGDFGTLW